MLSQCVWHALPLSSISSSLTTFSSVFVCYLYIHVCTCTRIVSSFSVSLLHVPVCVCIYSVSMCTRPCNVHVHVYIQCTRPCTCTCMSSCAAVVGRSSILGGLIIPVLLALGFESFSCSVCNDVFSEATTQTHFWVLQLPEQLVHTHH